MKTNIDLTTNSLTITTNKVYEYCELFDDLGENDIVQANEVHPDYIACEQFLYSLDINECKILMNCGTVTLQVISKVTDCLNKDFIDWYLPN